MTERYKYCRTVPGTRSLYCIIPITNTSVEVRQFSLSQVKTIEMLSSGPSYGCFVNPGKTWLIVKPQHERDAKELFSGTGIGITSEGKRHLGAALGSRSFLESYISDKVKMWTSTILNLSLIAKTQPHAAYCAFVHAVSGL